MLFQVYLVDDEQLALSALEKYVPWNAHGFEVVGRNTNPVKAIEEIRELCPHVVFTDVKMPVLNGLELIEKLREMQPGLEFVILSAHSDFQLVRSSFKLNINDYILKPLSRENYQEVLSNLLIKLQNKNKSLNINYSYDGTNGKMNAILDYINQNISQKHSLASISNQFFLSPNTICQYFSKFLNTSFINYLTEARMKKACELLYTTKPVKEIASMCGYEDYFYFTKVFQNYFHCTPSQFRIKGNSDEKVNTNEDEKTHQP